MTASPTVDTSSIDAVAGKAQEALGHLDALNTTASPQISTAALDAFIAKIAEARAALSALGSIPAGGGGANASVGARRSFQPAPAGPRISA